MSEESGKDTDKQFLEHEIETLRTQVAQISETNENYRSQVMSTMTGQIDVHATRLEEEIKNRFFSKAKNFAWLVGLLFIAATAGGLWNAWLQIPKWVEQSVKEKVEQSTTTIAKEVELKLESALNEAKDELNRSLQSSARDSLSRHAEILREHGEKAEEIAKMVTRLGQPLALLEASEKGDLEKVTQLLHDNADVTIRDSSGRTPLLLATMNGKREVATALLDSGAATNASGWDGKTALILAAEYGFGNIVDDLLARGVEYDAIDKQGRSALLHAASNGYAPIVDKLATFADMELAISDGTTPLIEAIEKGHDRIVDNLMENGADVNTGRTNGDSPLIIAVTLRSELVVEDLLSYGADASAINDAGETALTIAERLGWQEISELLKASE